MFSERFSEFTVTATGTVNPEAPKLLSTDNLEML